MPTSPHSQFTDEQIQEIRTRFTQFRVLVVGRANAGKTTLLRKICNATGDPIVFRPNGEKIDSSTLDGSIRRGEHDIENQMIFEGSPGFIFHDSRGFEAGDSAELNIVQSFIDRRSKSRSVHEQLHAIWYCIPTSDDCRPITAAEKKFFNECGTGIVPVIVLWTKTDSLDNDRIMQLMGEGKTLSDAKQQAPQQAWAEYEKRIYPRFALFKYPPKAFVMLRNMHKPDADCKDLIERTAAVLSSEELQQIFLSAQQNGVELCIKYGIKRVLSAIESVLSGGFKDNRGNWAYFVSIVLGYFPQLRITTDEHIYRMLDLSTIESGHYYDRMEPIISKNNIIYREHHNKGSVSKIMSPVLSGLPTTFHMKELTHCVIVAAIVGNLSFFLNQGSPGQGNSLEAAVKCYQESTCDTSIKEAVKHFFEHSYVNHGFFSLGHTADRLLLVKAATQIAMDNLMYPQ